ncbi:MAG: trypsin-like peptidase domain-containing protein [Gemmataceae bacterium]
MIRSFARLGPLAAVLALSAPAVAQETVYKKALKSTVLVVQPVDREGKMVRLRTGSGSVIDAKQKLILTNYHVVRDIPDATVCFPQFDKQGKLISERDKYFSLEVLSQVGLKGKVIAKDPTRDLAIIQLPKEVPLPVGTPALKLAKDSPEVSERVHSIGSPGISVALFNYSEGAVKAVGPKSWKVENMELSARVIETNSGTNRGDSGGPLLNDKVELVGVTQGVTSEGQLSNPVALFIDVSEVKTLLKNSKIKLSMPSASMAADTPPKAEKPAATTTSDTTTTDAEKKEKQAATKLELAKELAGSKPEKAIERYKEIVANFPGTKAAAEAKQLLEKK